MRGLTAEEYLFLSRVAEDEGVCSPACVALPPSPGSSARSLAAQGRLLISVCPYAGARHGELTPAGREAMRLHEALAALEGVS